MATVNSETSILKMAEALAQPETLIDQFVEVATGGAAPARPAASAATSRLEPIDPDSGGFLRVSIAPSLEAIEAEWKALEAQAASSPYQRFDLTAAWVRHAAHAEGVEAKIGVVRDLPGRLRMILPFGVTRQLGLRVATYLGGSHFNLNMPLADPTLRLGADAARGLLDAYAKEADADLFLLRNQPERWRGIEHAFFCLPHYGAPDDVRLVVIDGDFDSFLLHQLSRKMRSELRRKTIKFRDAGVAGAARASSPVEVERYLDTFIAQKTKRLSAQGLDDPFTLPGVKSFLREAALQGLAGEGGLEMHALLREGKLISVRAGIRHRDHLSFMVQSFDADEALAKYSPSEYLLTEVMLAERMDGVTNFDFGVGDARFKQVWSNDVVALFNMAHGVSRKGQMLASLVQSKDAAKRYIKRNPRLFSAVRDARALSAKFKATAGLLFFA